MELNRAKMERLSAAIRTAAADASDMDDMRPLEIVHAAMWAVSHIFAAYVYDPTREFTWMTHGLDGLCQEMRRQAEEHLLTALGVGDELDDEGDAGPV